jgi:hypothetical protein
MITMPSYVFRIRIEFEIIKIEIYEYTYPYPTLADILHSVSLQSRHGFMAYLA